MSACTSSERNFLSISSVLIPVNELLQNAWRNEDLITLSSWLKSVGLVLQHFVMRHMHNNSPSRSLKSCNVLHVMLSQGAGDVNVYIAIVDFQEGVDQ